MEARTTERTAHDSAPKFFPSTLELALLRGALADGADAVRAWETWRNAVNVEALDSESHRLLPLLGHNLKRLGVEHPLLVRYRSVHKQAWYKNRLTFHALAKVLVELDEANIETMVLKGTALALTCYREVGLRPMEDFDILVPRDQRDAAIHRLETAGWSPHPGAKKGLLQGNLRHGCAFRSAARAELDLHWSASADACYPDADRNFWSASVPFSVEGVATRALCPAHLLVHTLAHAYASHDRVIRWVADATMILRAQGERLDWGRLVDETRARRLVLPVRATLRYLDQHEFTKVPANVLRDLEGCEPSMMERAEYAHRQSVRPYSLPNKLLRLWFWNWRYRGHLPPLAAAVELPGFLRQYTAR